MYKLPVSCSVCLHRKEARVHTEVAPRKRLVWDQAYLGDRVELGGRVGLGGRLDLLERVAIG